MELTTERNPMDFVEFLGYVWIATPHDATNEVFAEVWVLFNSVCKIERNADECVLSHWGSFKN